MSGRMVHLLTGPTGNPVSIYTYKQPWDCCGCSFGGGGGGGGGFWFASRYEYFVVFGCLPAPVPFVCFLCLLLLLLLLFVSYEFWRASGYDSFILVCVFLLLLHLFIFFTTSFFFCYCCF